MATRKEKKNEALVKDIYIWCCERNLWDDCIIYFNGKAWSTHETWGDVKGTRVGCKLYEYEDKNPCDYFEYGNPNTVSMSFEGSLYNVINYYFDIPGYSKWHDDFHKLFEKHGFYFELGYAWSLSAYEL